MVDIRVKQFKSHIGKAFASSWLNAISRLVFYSILTKVGGIEAIGAWGLGTALAEPILKFSTLGMRSVQATDRENTFSFKSFLAIRAFLLIVAIFVCYVGYLLVPVESGLAPFVGFAILSRVAESIFDISTGEFQRRKGFDFIALSSAARISSVCVFFILVFVLELKIYVGLFVFVALQFLQALLELLFCAVTQKSGSDVHPPSKTAYKNMLTNSVHVGLAAGSVSFLMNVNRFTLSFLGTISAVGILTAASMLIGLGQIVVRGLTLVILPLLAGKENTELDLDRKVQVLEHAAVVIMMFVGCAIAFFGEPLLLLIFNQDVANERLFVGAFVGVSGLRFASTLSHNRMLGRKIFRKETSALPLYLVFGVAVSIISIVILEIWGSVIASVLTWGFVWHRRRVILSASDAV